LGTSRKGVDIRKGGQRVNMVEIFCKHVQKWKNEPCGNYSKSGGGGLKKNDGGGEFNCDKL
jgi:hypothetical protein